MAYVIAEIGQNHNGSLGIAKELIQMAADPRPAPMTTGEELPLLAANAVKFTKRKLSEEGSRAMMAAKYEGRNSFGPDYGSHRMALEFSMAELAELSKYTRGVGLDFGLTVCHPDLVRRSLAEIPHLNFLKVASRDLTNIPLLDAIAAADLPSKVSVIISTGMATEQDLADALAILRSVRPLVVMHCRSIYPCPPEAWDLQVIPALHAKTWQMTGEVAVGFSDHSVGVLAPAIARAMGASVIEKHVTLDRRMRGTDQLGSVEREGLYRMLRSIEETELGMTGPTEVFMSPGVKAAKAKLERSLHYASSLNPGTVIEPRHLVMLSPGDGLRYGMRDQIIGETLVRSVEKHDAVDLVDLEG